MQICKRCQTAKPQAEFYVGFATCKNCHKASVRANYLEKLKDPIWREKELDRQREKSRRMRERGQNPSTEAMRRGAKAWVARNSLKRRAHGKVANAIKTGKLARKPCETCANPETEAHHDDYSKPLDVRWFCVKHHAAHHVALRRLERATTSAVIETESELATK